jgi:cholesterol transport system auxiliary component
MKRQIACAAAALLLGACVNVLPKAAPASPRFLISSVSFEADAAPVDWSLTVDDPQATRIYDNTRIALAREPGRIEFYADGEWGDRAPRLFQAALIRSFENTGRILGVGDRISQPASAYALQADIRRMEADGMAGGPKAVFSVYVRLADRSGKVVAAKLFETEIAAAADSGPAVARALDAAVGESLREIVGWTFASVEAVRAANGPARSGGQAK